MASADWVALTGGLDQATVDRGVSAGYTPPNGGGSFVHGFHSLVATPGAVGFRCDPVSDGTNFDPMGKGGSIRGAVKRGISGGNTGWAPLLFIGLQGGAVTDLAYILGLEDADP